MEDLKERIYRIIKGPQLMSFATVTRDNRPWVRYVWASANTDLDIVFPTFTSSRKAEQVAINPEVHITCGVSNIENAKEYVQICGRAVISTEKKLRYENWNDNLKTYYSGPNDPDYCICIVRPYMIELNSMTDFKPQVWTAS